jgi:hypothetical protein
MTVSIKEEKTEQDGPLARGKASFDWAVLFAALALLFPVSAIIGIGLAERSRRKSYSRWKSAMAMAVWCGILGGVLRVMLKLPVVP